MAFRFRFGLFSLITSCVAVGLLLGVWGTKCRQAKRKDLAFDFLRNSSVHLGFGKSFEFNASTIEFVDLNNDPLTQTIASHLATLDNLKVVRVANPEKWVKHFERFPIVRQAVVNGNQRKLSEIQVSFFEPLSLEVLVQKLEAILEMRIVLPADTHHNPQISVPENISIKDVFEFLKTQHSLDYRVVEFGVDLRKIKQE